MPALTKHKDNISKDIIKCCTISTLAEDSLDRYDLKSC